MLHCEPSLSLSSIPIHPTMNYENILYEVDNEHIAWLTLNRPDKLNAMTIQMIKEFRHALEQAEHDKSVHVVVVRGAGRGFCAGHDLVEDATDEWDSFYHYRNHYFQQFEDFTTPWRITKPVIASVRSIAIGKGFELSLFCDITIVSDDVRLGYKELRYGISAHSMFLPWLVNMKMAKDLLLTGREVTAAEAKEIGLVTDVVPLAELDEATLKKARLLAAMPLEMNRAHKAYVNKVYEIQGIKAATDNYLELLPTFGYVQVPEYERFMETVNEKGLKPALKDANAKFERLE